ncbi:PepSY-associated TM helix domain-containing protein [Pseudoalteromonas sp. MMG007]|uniref:PepSY-associated TM helix domain-containing protein n=1 Tax=Pseudoalteromonas sp. MMG007 TaxID=2822684 RepID=UPI001B37B277|nr:PepSY-associated TM helix domain-containing protein [Pseudoalteromonas sp. MMG007]MBQ4856840.1 PepSY domain-containing protein [Pseudoalteromonas sp. MMG007]
MKSISLKKLFLLHSWVGIVTGILLFIVCFSGAIAVLSRPELKIWANPELHQLSALPSEKVTALINQYHQQVPPSFGKNIHVYLPSGHNTHLLTILFESHEGDENYDEEAAYVYQFDPRNFKLVNQYYGAADYFYENRKTDAPSFIGHFHADLHLGRPIGLILTGFLGLTLLVSTITGLFIHRQLIKELFTFRRNKDLDVVVNDAHKIMGIWGSLFHGVIGFTGAFLGLATVILLPAAAFVSFGGDQDKLVQKFTAMPEPVISEQYQMTDINSILVDAKTRYPKAKVVDLTIMAHNDQNAEVYLRLIGGDAVASQLLQYHGSGEFSKTMSSFGDIPGPAIKVLSLLFPLHFGNFAGVFVKIIWSLLGLTTALLPLSGMMMWLAKRSRGSNPTLSQSAYQAWNRVIIGSCGGLVLATAILFPAQVLLNHFVAAQFHNAYFGPLFFYSWLAWCLLAIFPLNYHRYLQMTLVITGLACITVLPLNLLLSESHAFMADNLLVTVVDISFLILGAGIIYLSQRVVANRFELKQQTVLKQEPV